MPGTLPLDEPVLPDPQRREAREARMGELEADIATYESEFWARHQQRWQDELVQVGQALAATFNDWNQVQFLRGRWNQLIALTQLPESAKAELNSLREEAKEEMTDG